MQELTTLQKFNVLAEISCKSKATIKSYQSHIKSFIEKHGEDAQQETIIDHLYYLRTKRKYDGSSLNIVKYALIYYFKEVKGQTITIQIPKIKRRQSIPKPLNKSVIKALIQSTSNLKHRILIELAYDAGLRPFELVQLKWDDLDLNNNNGMINRGKGDKDRILYLSKVVTRHLKDYKISRKNQNCIYVFDSEWNPNFHISKRTYQQVIKNSAKKAKIDFNINAYRLRHSFGSHLKESGLPVEDIQPRMGHSSIKTTLGYARVETPKKIINLLDDEYFTDTKVIRNST